MIATLPQPFVSPYNSWVPEGIYERLIDPVVLGGWVIERRRPWQLGFLNARKAHEFARERGVWLSSPLLRSGGDTTLLWRVGLLRLPAQGHRR